LNDEKSLNCCDEHVHVPDCGFALSAFTQLTGRQEGHLVY